MKNRYSDNTRHNNIVFQIKETVCCFPVHPCKERIRLEVCNTGQPVPEEHLVHLFEAFSLADSVRSQEHATEISLAVVKSIIQAYSSEYSVENSKTVCVFG
ncbi:MAG: hypothetical protein JW904_15015 [Spirochaetales bacterium]|nr:hypothetical protein [Spirochaetales bacterium]